MPDYVVPIPSEDYKHLVHKAIAFDVVCETVKNVQTYQWDDVLLPLCRGIAPEKFSGAKDGDGPGDDTAKTAE